MSSPKEQVLDKEPQQDTLQLQATAAGQSSARAPSVTPADKGAVRILSAQDDAELGGSVDEGAAPTAEVAAVPEDHAITAREDGGDVESAAAVTNPVRGTSDLTKHRSDPACTTPCVLQSC